MALEVYLVYSQHYQDTHPELERVYLDRAKAHEFVYLLNNDPGRSGHMTYSVKSELVSDA